MTTFQILGLAAASLFAVATAWRVARRRIGAVSGLLWIAVWTAAGTTILFPEITVVAANLLGIQRGADLVFYLAILAGLAGFYAVFNRLRHLDQALTVLTRRLALHESRSEGTAGAAEPPPPMPSHSQDDESDLSP